MIWEGSQAADDPVEERPTRHPFWMLALTGFATSIDAMAIGVGLAFLDVPILPVAATIGLTTFLLVTAGVLLGRVLGVVVGKRSEIFGGIVLIGIGVAILVEHLHLL
jgi:putative Mn2+ efflux pump MntP